MNYSRIGLAALGAFVAYFIFGGLMAAVPSLRTEFLKYPAIYRSQDSIKSVMPAGMLAMFVAMVVLAVIYAMIYQGGSGLIEGARFGALIGVFSVCTFVIHNYVNLNIGLKITVQQAIGYFIVWVVTGVAIGLIYKPLTAR
jgi:hypothetical protein